MIIYKDIISGDELFTDAFKFKVENGIIEMDTRKISKKADDIDDSLIGGNASAEEAAEETEGATESGYEIVLANKLQQMPPFDKKGYLAHLKGYLKSVEAKMKENGKSEEAIANFKTNATAHAKKIVKNISEMEVFTGESTNPDGMQVLIDYREDGITPFAIFFEEGLEAEKA